MEEQNRRDFSEMLRAIDSVYLLKVLHDREMSYLYEKWPPSDYLGEEAFHLRARPGRSVREVRR